MQPAMATRVAINAASTTNGATAAGIIDTLMPEGQKADFVSIDVIATTADVVSNKPTVLKLMEADDTATTSFANISGTVGGTDFTIPNANTAATAVIQNSYKFNVDTKKRKRYLRVVVSPQTTQNITVVAQLMKGHIAPITAARANALTLVEV